MNNSIKDSYPVKEKYVLPAYNSPFRLLFITAFTVFIAELSIMIILSFLPPLSMLTEAIVDSTLLVVILSPALYLFLVHPLVMHIDMRKKAEDVLKKSEEKYRRLFENATDAIVIADAETGIILDVNQKAEELLGLPVEKLVGMHQEQLHPKEESKRYRKIFQDYVKEYYIHGGKTISENLFVCHKNGLRIPVEISASIIEIGDKKIIQGFFKNITERKKAEQIRLQNESLILASKTKAEFLATMSHELRTPLNPIIGFSELLKKEVHGELNEKQERYVDNIFKSGKNLLSLITDILDLSRVEAGKMELVIEKMPVPAAIDAILELIKESAANRNIVIRKKLDTQLDIVETDNLRFKQVLFNLLSNAVKFSKPEGGTVTLAAKKEGNMAKISISDTGIGIREEDMEKLFKEFVQLDSGISRHYGGTGLGLAISKKLVEMQGGKITAESKFGEGSTFTFYLPVHQ